MKQIYCSALLLAAGLFTASAASGVKVVAADYSAPVAFEVAPGQVVILKFRGVKPHSSGELRSARAESETLPTTLAGLAGRLQQGTQSLAIPIFSVGQINGCGDNHPTHEGCILTTVRIQIPFELEVAADTNATFPAAPLVRMILDVDGEPSDPVLLQPVAVNSHVLTSCDVNRPVPGESCDRMAFHADGTPVNASAPAKRGEVITIHAFGLGAASPAVATGRPSPAGADVSGWGALRVWASVRNQPLNANPAAPRFFAADLMNPRESGLEFAGLAPGYVGLYQLNLRTPSSLEVIMPCGGEVHANALALVTTRQGSEVVPFCVAP